MADKETVKQSVRVTPQKLRKRAVALMKELRSKPNELGGTLVKAKRQQTYYSSYGQAEPSWYQTMCSVLNISTEVYLCLQDMVRLKK